MLKKYFVTFALLFCSSLYAQGEVEEVVVTAEQGEESVANDSLSSAALSGEKLADAGIENVEDVAAYIPNLTLTETETGVNVFIRGIGSGVNQGFDQSVGLYLDGVPLPRGQMARAPFLDLEGVNVLRGPQYVLDGNFSIAGSIHLETKYNKDEFEAAMDINVQPEQNNRKLLLTMSAPLGYSSGARVAVQKLTSDGYVENVTLGEYGPAKDELLIRGVFFSQPTDFLSFKLKAEKGRFDQTGRQIEIIQNEATPDPRDFPEYSWIAPTATGPRPPTRTTLPTTILRPEATNPIDYAYGPARIFYDIGDTLTGSNDFYWAGFTYLDRVATNYQEAGAELPQGLLDQNIDFRRGADAAEFSDNDTFNLTLNSMLEFGSHKFKLTNSYIDYEVDELIDSDFTAAPLFETTQSEEYEQEFHRLDYELNYSDSFSLSAGFSHLDSELQFSDIVQPILNGPSNYSEISYFGVGNPLIVFNGQNPTDLIQPANFSTETPLASLFGRIGGIGLQAVSLFQTLVPDRQFTQDSTIKAGYLQAKFDFSPALRSTLGVRYTHSEKYAVRDYALLFRNGDPFIPLTPEDDTFLVRAAGVSGQLLNFQFHSDRATRFLSTGAPLNNAQPALRPEKPRTEEQFLPSASLEWDATPDLTLIFAYRTANKLGGFDARSSATPSVVIGTGLSPGTFEYEDEEAVSYEMGAIWYLPQDLGELNATAFFTTYTDLQVSAADRAFGFTVQNAGEAVSKGIELEGILNFTESINMQYSMAWIDFEFKDYLLGSCALGERADNYFQAAAEGTLNNLPPIGTPIPIRYEDTVFISTQVDANDPYRYLGAAFNNASPFESLGNYLETAVQNPAFCDRNGFTNQYVAEYQGTFTLNYKKETNAGIFKSALDIIYNSGYETTVSFDSSVAQDEFIQLNGRIGLLSGYESWEIALTGSNLTNEKIKTYAAELPIGARIAGARGHYAFISPPRTLGINFRYKFL